MTVTTASGRNLCIPARHPVFEPVGVYEDGDRVDPVTVDVTSGRADSVLCPGTLIIVDNKVETVVSLKTGF